MADRFVGCRRRTMAIVAMALGFVLLLAAGDIATGPESMLQAMAGPFAKSGKSVVICPDGTEAVIVGGLPQCSHGPDPAPPGLDPDRRVDPVSRREARAAAAANPLWCEGDGTSGKRVQVLYVREEGTASKYATYLDSFRTWTTQMDEIFSRNAQMTGPDRHIRFVHDGACNLVIPEVVVPNGQLADWNLGITALADAGYGGANRKIVFFADTTVFCGIGTYYGDERKDSANWNNSGGYARADRGCWSAMVISHELGHNLGAVGDNAPHTTRYGHCFDEYDIMCYSDAPGAPPMVYGCNDTFFDDTMFDCNHDDYYNTAPLPGTYLATSWNVADSAYLITPPSTGTPQPTATLWPTVPAIPTLTPTPTPAPPVNDSRSNPKAITGPFPYTEQASVTNATVAGDDPVLSCANRVARQSLWYSLTPDSASTVTVSLAGTGFDTLLGAYAGTPSEAAQIACSDDESTSILTSRITFTAAAGTTYVFVAGSYSGTAFGSLNLRVELSGPAATATPVPPTRTPVPPTRTPNPTATATPPPSPDTRAPVVRILSPKSKARLSSLSSVSVEASDPGGAVAKVEVLACTTANCNPLVSGVLKGSDASAPYVVQIAPAIRSGAVRLAARATDASGNVGTSAVVSVTVGRRMAGAPPGKACAQDGAAANRDGSRDGRPDRDGRERRDRKDRPGGRADGSVDRAGVRDCDASGRGKASSADDAPPGGNAPERPGRSAEKTGVSLSRP